MAEEKDSLIKDLLKNPYEVEMEDFFETTEAEIDQFDEQSWKKGKGYSCPSFPEFDKRMEGLELGLFMFAGESNSGKSAYMMNLMFDYCTNPDNKLFGLYYSLDDAKEELIPRFVAMDQLIPISVASKPDRYKEMVDNGEEGSAVYQEWLEKREAGLQRLKDLKRQFKLMDGEKITCGEQLLDHARKVQMYVRAYDPEYNIIIGIDSLSDMVFASKNFKTDKELNDYIAKEVKRWAVTELKAPIFGSLHLRKLNQNRRPTVDDVKESGKYIYEASVLFLVHNDVSKNKQAATIYYNEDDTDEKMPILELDWAKNKKSAYKGKTHHYFTPNYSKISECSTDVMKRFDALIYTN
jgi:replicative DNA helicase